MAPCVYVVFRVWGLGLWAQDLRFCIQGLGFGALGLRFRLWVQGIGFRAF